MAINQNLNLTAFNDVLKEINVKNIAKIIAANDAYITTKNVEKGNDLTSKVSPDTSSKLAPIEQSNEMVDILSKIYGFMQQSNTDKMKRLEKENNFKEEQDLELLQKHKELIAAIRKLKLSSSASLVSGNEDDEDDDSSDYPFFDLDRRPRPKEKEKKSDGKRKPRKTPKGLSRGKFGIRALGGSMVIASAFALPWMAAGAQMEKTIEDPNAPDIKDSPFAKFVRGESDTQGQAAQQNRRASLKEVRASEIKLALETKPPFTDAELIEEYGMDRSQLKDFVEKNPKGVLRPEKQTPVPNQVPNQEQSPKETIDIPTQSSPSIPVEQSLSKNESVIIEPSPASTDVLNRAIKENIRAKLENKMGGNETNVTNNNIMNNSSSSSGSSAVASLPSIRNLEPTFQRMILDSTRVV
jgi:hypothetical protein